MRRAIRSGIWFARGDYRGDDPFVWLRISAVALFCIVGLAVWWVSPVSRDLDTLGIWLQPHRYAWYALPMVMLVFVGLAIVPVVLLIAATGVAFGPILGPLYAMAGCLASGSLGFAIGRRLGRQRVEQLGGRRVARVSHVLERNGTLAVFLVRKVPVPFMLTNIVVGASSVSYRDFVIGTLLGMGGFVVALAGFGYELTRAVRNPSPRTLIAAALFVSVPLTLAWGINRALRPARPA